MFIKDFSNFDIFKSHSGSKLINGLKIMISGVILFIIPVCLQANDDNIQSTSNIPKKIIIYGKDQCIYCIRAKNLLDKMQMDYEAIDLADNPELVIELINQTKQDTVPYIFIDGKFIGGYTELQEVIKQE